MARPVWLVHLQKCGGSSVAAAVSRSLRELGLAAPERRNAQVGTRMLWGAKPTSNERWAKFEAGDFEDLIFCAAHMAHQETWMSKCIRAFLMRDPILRVWSLYTFCRSTHTTELSATAKKAKNLERFMAMAPGPCSNAGVNILLGRSYDVPVTEDDFFQAQRVLATFEVTGTLERLDEFLPQLHTHIQARYGAEFPPLELLHENRSGKALKTRDMLKPQLVKLLEEKNQWDLRLWESLR